LTLNDFLSKLREMGEIREIKGKNHKLWPLYANESLWGIAVSWLSLFSSIFIYQQLLSLVNFRWALTGVFLFWSLFGLTKLLGTSLAENLSLKLGLKAQIGLGLGSLALAATLFSLASLRLPILVFAVVSWGFSAGVYWFGWHGLVGKLQDRNHYGSAYGTSSALSTMTGFLTPFLGGILITFGGYPLLFGVALIIIILAFFSLRFLPGEKTHHDATFKEVLKLFVSNPRDFLANFSVGALEVITVGFILYLFLVLKTELALGGFFSLSLFFVALTRILIGRMIDLGKTKNLTIIGCLARGLVWWGRIATRNVSLLLGLNIVNGLAVGAVGMPLEVLALEKGIDGQSLGRAVLFREVAICLGYIAVGIILAILAFFGLPLRAGFVVAIPLSLVPILIYKTHD